MIDSQSSRIWGIKTVYRGKARQVVSVDVVEIR